MKIKTNRSSYTLIERLGIVLNSEIVDEFLSLYPSDEIHIDEEKLIEKLRRGLTDEDIEEQICFTRDLTLNITENCSFRCKYCAYSGCYELVRQHNTKKMEFQTAKKAIDILLNLVRSKKCKSKNKYISIGFYGGEALLEFNLIRDIVKYTIKEIRLKRMDNIYKPRFRLSTNGYLLNREDILDFLVTNDFLIDISLDGPKSEHDKFRITRDGEETWDIIWRNINNIYIKYPVFYSKNVSYLVTLHPWHDFNQIENFFLENKNYFDHERIIANHVSTIFLKEKFKKKWFYKAISQHNKLSDSRVNKHIEDRLSLRKINMDTSFTNMCFPGGIKFFVSSGGNIYVCERLKQDIPIGDVNNGLDFDAIRKIQRVWNEEVIRNRCWECDAWAFCNVCAAQSENKYGIGIDCTYKHQFKKIITNYIVEKEEEDRNTDKNSKDFTNIKEYIQQL